jgi:arginase
MAGDAVIEAPSVLGPLPRGAEQLPQALLDAGLTEAVDAGHAGHAGRVPPPPYSPLRLR